jgi:hypothetical protein
MDCSDYGCEWNVLEEEDIIKVSTYMDNFNMRHFLKLIGAEDAIVSEGL